ncbi:disks large-associated protein 5-like [Battus philenor]|uniref:disks large-associated protein 5-like n=1 Tax=Battus philenor TaxID=42288 RepID=UPI0035D03747
MDRSFDIITLLKNHQKKHQHKHTSKMNVSAGVQKRLEKNIKLRKSNRLTIFDSIRNLAPCEEVVLDPISEKQKKIEHRRLQLEKWKLEKVEKRKEAAAHKKKPFVIGVPHAPLKYEPPPPPKAMPSKSGRVTRSQSKANNQIVQKSTKLSKTKLSQSFAPKNAEFKPPKLKNSDTLPSLVSIGATRKTRKTDITFNPVLSDSQKSTQSEPSIKVQTINNNKTTEKPLRNKNKSPSHKDLQSTSKSTNETLKKLPKKNKTPKKTVKAETKVTPKNKPPKSESSSEERLRSAKSPTSQTYNGDLNISNLLDTPLTPEQIAAEVKNISPCVTLSRGKDKARKEMKKKMEEGLLDDDSSNIESVEYFRRQLDSEVMRITEMCDTWEKISQQLLLPESIQELVLTAIGQGRLLVSQKLAQFGSLVSACARPEPGAALVTPADLHGFWDMVFMQVENVDMRFKKLEELRARNWVEEVPVIQKRRVQKTVKTNARPAATSRLRDVIAAARKAKKEQETTESSTEVVENVESKTFEGVFFCVRSPVSSPVPASTPSKSSLLKVVLSSEAKKASASKNSASLAMLRASIISRNVENSEVKHGKESMSPIDLTATPARSILKSVNTSTKKKSHRKSFKMVLFNDSDTEANDIDILANSIENNKEKERVKEDDKENERRKSKIETQKAVEERSPVLTRSRRKSIGMTLMDMSIGNLEEQLRMGEKKEELSKINQTPKRTRRRKSSAYV